MFIFGGQDDTLPIYTCSIISLLGAPILYTFCYHKKIKQFDGQLHLRRK